MESKYYHLTGGTRSFLVLHDLLNPSEEFPIHTQSDWELIYIIRGCGTFVIGDQSQPFTKDEIFLIPPDMLHGWIFRQQSRQCGRGYLSAFQEKPV